MSDGDFPARPRGTFDTGVVLVIAPDPAPAWVLAVIADIRVSGVSTAVVRVNPPRWPRPLRTIPLSGAWRAGDTSAEAQSQLKGVTQTWTGLDALPVAVALVADLSSEVNYRPVAADDPAVISVVFGDGHNRARPSAFVTALLRGPSVGYVEAVRQDSRSSRCLERIPVLLDSVSWSRSRNALLWKAASIVPRAVLTSLGGSLVEYAGSSKPASRGARLPPGALRAVMGARAVWDLAERTLHPERWSVAIQAASEGLPEARELSERRTSWVSVGDGIADPCLVHVAGRTYLFVEMIRAGRPASIGVAEIANDGTTGAFREVLQRPYHLSYPQVFEDAGSLWMIVEMAGSGRVALFEAEDFPHRWREATTLLDGVRASDPTLHRNSDGYWLWTSIARYGAIRNADLWLFFSDDLHGPWFAHPRNPIVSDPRRSRPAGSVFSIDGRLFRPAQDCVARYGHRIALNEVETLDRTRYRETLVSQIGPEWSTGLVATHTFSRAGGWQALDGAVSCSG